MATTTLDFYNEVYNDEFDPEFSDSMLKEILMLAWDYL